MKIGSIVLLAVTLVGIKTTVFAANFGNTETSAWADTPMGRFECSTTKDHRQVLAIDGKEIYRTPDRLKGYMGEAGAKLLSQGIYLNPLMVAPDSACPNIIANNAGYVVYEIELAPLISGNPVMDEAFPPVYGMLGYTIIDFNSNPPTQILLLNEGQSREGDKYQPRLTWDAKGFTMRYFGYPYNHSGRYPKPKFHKIRFDFASQKVKKID